MKMIKDLKSKTAVKNSIYNLVKPITSGFFHDSYWSPVHQTWKALESNGMEISIDKSYYTDLTSKTWEFTATINNFKLSGRMIASFCGPSNDPTATYDLCFILN